MARAKAFFLILLVCGATSLVAVAAPAEAAAKPCWERVLDDWSQDGFIDGTYSSKCLDEALHKVPEDIRAYGNFEEQVKAARQAAVRLPQGSISGGSNSGGNGSQTTPREREPRANGKDETLVARAMGTRGNNADSVPLPLLILLGLAGALIAAGGTGLAVRKVRAHRTAG